MLDLRKNINLKGPNGRCCVQFLTETISLGILGFRNLRFFCFVIIV